MSNYLLKKNSSYSQKHKRLNSVVKNIAALESIMRSSYKVGDIRIRTTGKLIQFIWKRVDFLEFDRQWCPSVNHKLLESKLDLKFTPDSSVSLKREISPEERGFLYCSYKCSDVENKKKLTLIEKHPILMTSGRSRKKILKALDMLSKILSCSKELENISLLLRLIWKVGVKT